MMNRAFAVAFSWMRVSHLPHENQDSSKSLCEVIFCECLNSAGVF